MLQNDREKLNRLEDLKRKLFSKDYKVRLEHRDSFPHFREREVPASWEEKDPDEKEKPQIKASMFKKFFIFSIIFFAFAVFYASYTFLGNSNAVSNDNIDIAVLSNAYTAGGEEYPLLLEITNRNTSPLELVDLLVEYPKGSTANEEGDNEHIRLSLGTIPSGGTKSENVKLVLFGEQGSTRQIKISIEYRVEGSNAIFVKDKYFDVSINSTPINLSIDAPEEVSTNQDIALNLKASLNATKSVSNILLKVDYPIGFQFVKAVPAPTLGNNIWNLGDLAPGAEHSVQIIGKMVDVFEGEEKIFRVWSGSQSTSDKSAIDVVFNSAEHIVSIKKSSIEANLVINGVSEREYASDSKTAIQAQIQWRNNLDSKINDLIITAKLYGNALDRKTVSASQGFYDSSKDTITWDKNSFSKFAQVSPGDSGSVSFSFSPNILFSGARGILSSPAINVEISVVGRQDQGGGVVTSLSSSESRIIKIISDVGLVSKALYYSGPFQNKGPIPPKVEQKTTYTVTWSVSNTSNPISKAVVHASLPSWVSYTGSFAPAGEDLSYDPNTKEITWNIGSIPSGSNITQKGKEVSFQIEFLASLSQVGTEPILLNNSTLTGHDDFANVDVRVNKSSLNTRLLNDPNFPVNGNRVVNAGTDTGTSVNTGTNSQ